MKKLGLHELRKEYIDFFTSKGHLPLPSFSLIPQNDKSLLLIGAGMAPMKKYFTGEATPPKERVTTCQKCIRTGDIENVGRTDRHATFFEMLGNFSFGDYFKHDAIFWAWEFLTKNLEIAEEDLWVTVYQDDDEAFAIWRDEVGVSEDKIVRLGKEDNFWELAIGPSGPCSEIYVDRGLEYGCGNPDCKPGCDCDRFIEIWNLVFTQFDKDEEGIYHPLANPNIDTGMGLERMATVLQHTNNIFEIDAIQAILQEICTLAGYTYGEDAGKDLSVRIITDHIRAITFMISDSIVPSNEGRGYVLRRLIRRAARHGRLLGITNPFLYKLSEKVIDSWSVSYENLKTNQNMIAEVIEKEENRFLKTLQTGLDLLEYAIVGLEEGEMLSGKDAFKLYDTYGFPIDLTREILEEHNLTLDESEFEEEMNLQKVRAREARDDGSEIGWSSQESSPLDHIDPSEFIGYETDYVIGTELTHIFKNGEVTDLLPEGEEGIFILATTPFYGESGGQVGDRGELQGRDFTVSITDTQKTKRGVIYSLGTVTEGTATVGQVDGKIDGERREKIRRNHSVTHLLHKALKEVLGDHVNQAGSLVEENMMRFDFTHYEKVSAEDLNKIEARVNEQIYHSLPVSTTIMSLEDAKEEGAVGLFEGKYGDEVRVLSMGDYSKELCGGTHVSNTSQIGMFKILSESGISAGVRRIESITGLSVYKYVNQLEEVQGHAASILKTSRGNVIERLQSVMEEEREFKLENERLQGELAKIQMGNVENELSKVEDISYLTLKLDQVPVPEMREMAESLRDKHEAVVVIASVSEDKLQFVVASPKSAIERGIQAGDVSKEVAQITGGNGGGRPDMATAGGKEIGKVDEALASVSAIIEKHIHG